MTQGSSAAFAAWFERATTYQPFPYQVELATAPKLPAVLRAPTGAGKTALALAWLWRRTMAPPDVRADTGRRLIWCLPTRVLVEQTHAAISTWFQKLGLTTDMPGNAEKVLPIALMGGGLEGRAGRRTAEIPWWLYPEQPLVLVGTQEMLLSRALNRGYGSSRYRWPQEFGLMHNDVLWVLDEVQLMGSGLLTTAQLQGFRDKFGTTGPAQTIWVSATQAQAWLQTPDHPAPDRVLALTAADHQDEKLSARYRARKVVAPSPLTAAQPDRVAAAVLQEHRAATLSLVVLNTVQRAQVVYQALDKLLAKGETASILQPLPDIRLVHSRFRGHERAGWLEWLGEPPPAGGRIVVATQVVEAGVDLDARALWTEVAPWMSFIQRCGRCNRRGEIADAFIHWLEVDKPEPYTTEELTATRDRLEHLNGRSADPEALAAIPWPEQPVSGQVLRRPDLMGLFDTSPDLSGNDLAVSALIRALDERDVYIYWRTWSGEVPERNLASALNTELCPAPVGRELESFLRRAAAWTYDHLEDRWRRVFPADTRPGQVLLLHASAGGYSPELGWTGREADGPVEPVPPIPEVASPGSDPAPPFLESETPGTEPLRAEDEAMAADPDATATRWLTVAQHTDAVVERLALLMQQLPPLPEIEQQALQIAARWHDAGKGHPVFQQTMHDVAAAIGEQLQTGETWAKTPKRLGRHCRRHFRHELASALLYLAQRDWSDDPQTNLSAYLIAAHHGKVRLAIRSLPNEQRPDDVTTRHALGVHEGDELVAPEDLGGGVVVPKGAALVLSVMELGGDPVCGPSWLQRMIELRDRTPGPFRLAFCEALLRAADIRASMAASGTISPATMEGERT